MPALIIPFVDFWGFIGYSLSVHWRNSLAPLEACNLAIRFPHRFSLWVNPSLGLVFLQGSHDRVGISKNGYAVCVL